jgi:two-component system chemotaxis sensor kinase CheA
VSEFEAYRGLFVAESRENHENLVKNLLLLELGSYQEAIDEIFRSIHTLKGASASMGFSTMEHLCHTMEDVFSLIRSGSADISPDLVNLLLACSDLIEQMLDDIESGGDSSSKSAETEINSLRQWIERHGVTPAAKEECQKIPVREELPPEPPRSEGDYCQEYEMQIIVSAECTMKDVRALLALGNLNALGTILSSNPSPEAIDEGRFDGTLHLIISSDAGEEALITAVSGTDIAEVDIRPAEKQEIPVPDEHPEVTKSTLTETQYTSPPDKTRESLISDISPDSIKSILAETQQYTSPPDTIRENLKPEVPPDSIQPAGADVPKASSPAKTRESLAPDILPDSAKPADADLQQSSAPDKTREIKNLRVNIQQLDHIMNLVEDLVINRGRLKQIAEQHKIKEMDEAIAMVDRSVSELQSLMMMIRMIPLNQIFNRLPRVVRDVARYDSKEVDFVMDGGETELDRSVMDGLNDPLLHLIRNAVNHGIESPEAREKAGKPRKGNVRLSARRDRDNVIIDLIDDGAGINVGKVKAKAIEKGLVTPEEAETFTTEQAIDLLFQPGFSTADKISDISGRGVGLDVVRRSIEALKGTIRVETTPGKGSRFELLLPPTMAIVDVMIVRINGKRLGIPISSIVEVANFRRDTTHHIGKGEAILLRDEVLQILWLNEMVGVSPSCEILIVVQYQKRKCCIPVDVVEGKQEVVVKPLSSFIGKTRGVSGVTILGDGGVVPVLDVNTIV